MISPIQSHFMGKDFDIRKKYPGYSRFMDQKVTPDVLSFIADCVLNLPDTADFTVRSIWASDYFKKNTEMFFRKPSPSDPTASAEYNKFIGQPLKTLAFSQVISEKKRGNRNFYTVSNKELVKYISVNERGASGFLYEYIVKVLSDSGFFFHFEVYRDQLKDRGPGQKYDPQYFNDLKSSFQHFMLGNTEINKTTEINRIFPKVLNPFAFRNGLPGSAGGYMTTEPFYYGDLMYNRKNFRDIRKPKNISRQEAALDAEAEKVKQDQEKKVTESEIKKARDKIKEKYVDSEVKDQWGKGEATQVHHIFPQSDYPEFAADMENLIKLTPEQHFNQAHAGGRTQEVDKDYQLQCLLAKCDSIECSISNGEFFYSKENFIKMINKCLNLDIGLESDFAEVKKTLRSLLMTA